MRSAAAPTHARFCARCDERNDPDAVFCVGCGARLTPEAPAATASAGSRCSGCGTANPPGALYCVACGRALGASPAAPLAPALAGAGQQTIVQPVYVRAAPPARIPLLARALWFVFIGLWVGQLWLVIAWLLNLTLLGLPIGMWMLAQMPLVMTLRLDPVAPRPPRAPAADAAGFAVRAAYFVLVGWWLSLLWLMLAWALAATVIGLPIAFVMFERVGPIMTLGEV